LLCHEHNANKNQNVNQKIEKKKRRKEEKMLTKKLWQMLCFATSITQIKIRMSTKKLRRKK